MFVDEKAVGEKEPVKVGKLKVSEAIRLGAQRRPQCMGKYFDDYGGSCAIGAAAEAMFGANRMTLRNSHIDGVLRDIPAPIQSVIIGMNDTGKYTREEIADWLEKGGY